MKNQKLQSLEYQTSLLLRALLAGIVFLIALMIGLSWWLTWSAQASQGGEGLTLLASSVFITVCGVLLIMVIGYMVLTELIVKTAGPPPAPGEDLNDINYRMNAEVNLLYESVSDQFEDLTGYSNAEVKQAGFSLEKLLHPGNREQVLEDFEKILAGTDNYEFEYQIVTCTGHEKWVWDRGQVIRDEHTQDTWLVGSLIDISTRKRSEVALREAREFSDAVINTAVEAVITIDARGTIGIFNLAAQQMFGYSIDEVKGTNVRTLMPQPYQGEHDQYIDRYLSTGNAQIIGKGREVSAQRRDGTVFPIYLSVSEVQIGGRRAFVGLIRDISMLHEAEKDAREHREQLAHVDRLTVLGEMASGIAHEINQPLTAISLFAQAGKRLLQAKNPERLPEIFDKLSQHALRAGSVIDRMQTFARRGESIREVTDCNTLIQEVVEFAEAEARLRDIIIEVDTSNDLQPVNVDSVQIQQVALNLLRNGMEAMQSVNCKNGNTIRMQTTLNDDDEIEVAIIDSGTGVPEEFVSHLFTPFSTTKESGMGMGLSICKKIITMHGGLLSFQNIDTGGAKFFFTLPPAEQGG